MSMAVEQARSTMDVHCSTHRSLPKARGVAAVGYVARSRPTKTDMPITLAICTRSKDSQVRSTQQQL